ncbi:cytochrome P450 [Streptomyces sp. YIM 121038]|uniref:cytochrome P450 n=1 Tax=Streptomyces sp. YIM 121038 TaxID=2136401 RepID=UPI0014860A98|nr:cytochrome P450 [Streptomyces sp. YIM 121038]
MPPGYTSATAPGVLPLLGHAPYFVYDALGFLESLPTHGDLVRIKLGPIRAYVPCHPALLREILNNDQVFDKGGPFYDRVREIAGNGLASCPHADHRGMRRMLQPAFSRRRTAEYGTFMEQEISALTKSWEEGSVIDALPTFYGIAVRTVARSLFATNIGDNTVEDIRQSYEIAFGNVFARMLMPKVLARFPLPVNRRFQQANAQLTMTVNAIMAQYKRSPVEHQDILSTLLAARTEDGAALTGDQIRDQVVTLIAGGSETTAATLSWACYLLTQHPAAEKRLHRETDSVLADRPARWEDLAQLPYTTRIITETLRLYPPGWFLTRTTTRPVTLAGTTLPTGTTVVFSPYVLHRNAAVFDNPRTFDPDRWLPERAATLPRGAFATFGHGARKCIGDNYAMAEAILMLATLAGRWRWEIAPGADPRPQRLTTFLRPRRTLLKLHARTVTTEENTP